MRTIARYSWLDAWCGLGSCNRGSVITEYAIVLPIFLVLVMGSFEMGRIYMVNSALEGALTQSTRLAMSGAMPEGYTERDLYVEDFVRTSLLAVGIRNGVSITTRIYESFSDIGEEEPYVDQDGDQAYDVGECFTDINGNGHWDADMGATGLGGEENIMVMTIDVEVSYMLSWIAPYMGGRESVRLSATTAIRNEPFGGVAWAPSDDVICT